MPRNRSIGPAGSLDASRPRPARSVGRQLAIDSIYLLVSFPLSLIAFVIVVVGLPIIAGTLYVARGLAHVERLRIGGVLGTDLAIPRYKRVPPGSGFFRRMGMLLTDGQAWLDAGYTLVAFVPAIVGFSIMISW